MLTDAFHKDPFWDEAGGTVPFLHGVLGGVPHLLLLRHPGRARP